MESKRPAVSPSSNVFAPCSHWQQARSRYPSLISPVVLVNTLLLQFPRSSAVSAISNCAASFAAKAADAPLDAVPRIPRLLSPPPFYFFLGMSGILNINQPKPHIWVISKSFSFFFS